MDRSLLQILACPVCKGGLIYDEPQQRLICRFDRLAYPIRDGIPIMLIDEAEKIEEEGL